MYRKALLHSWFIFIPAIFYAQHHYNTCETAYEICSKGAFEFQLNEGKPAAAREDIDCLGRFDNIAWFKWEIASPGYFTFVIYPDKSMLNDIDFAVYRLRPGQSCDDKELVRCMSSGVNLIGDQIMSSSSPCLGETGLSIAEPLKQTREEAGCQEGDNNFLTALHCVTGEQYLLAVAQYNNARAPYMISFCGSAELPCDSVFCEEFTQRASKLPEKKMASFMQRASGDYLPMFIEGVKRQHFVAIVEDEVGRVVKTEKFKVTDEEHNLFLSIRNLPVGRYHLTLKLKEQNIRGFFTKTAVEP